MWGGREGRGWREILGNNLDMEVSFMRSKWEKNIRGRERKKEREKQEGRQVENEGKEQGEG